ncbi:LTA synthase family protein [Salisediminibacterium halotolerans]|uniref:Phosphoglycerol transferase MdoB n=1 Tax=Salisediminibacterium halotolerans TaxID=517425 RepID=A0A1H9W961_9BACI|nr:LTA synthase family protein [Salisediminibacterium haloalkalitolerans]SES30207.1 Phosphoglycerol transferase MdoB [Salisediminibacterium haloalkalitolerans]
MKQFLRQHRLMVMLLMLLWLKTFLVSILTFDLMINQAVELLVFAFNPLAFLLTVFGLGLLLKEKYQTGYFFALTVILTVILYGNAVHYREFTDIITLPMLVMSGNAGDLMTSVAELIAWYDIFFFIDLPIIYWLIKKYRTVLTVKQAPIRYSKGLYTAITAVVLTIVFAGQVVQSEERAHSFNRENVIKTIGIFNFYVYDAYVHVATASQAVFAEGDDWSNIERHLDETSAEPNESMAGAAEGKNVVMVSLESVESFVIGETLDGEEITPFLNELIEDSFYFNNLYDQAGQGKTSDAEFMMHNSLYPLGRGAVFHEAYDNEYLPLLKQFQQRGYENAAFHANDESFYNRDEMYENLEYDTYYALDAFDVDEDNSVGWGLKDIDFIEQSMPYIEDDMEEPFFAKFKTLTNHFPYELDDEDHFIDQFDSNSNIVNRYFPTVRYTDEALRIMFEKFQDSGLYEDTIFVLYGDHYGIAESHYDELEDYLGYEVTPDEAVKLDRVPVIIHIPGMEDEAETIDTVSGHVDVMPTLINLMGMDEERHLMFGRDLLSDDRDDFAVQRDGTVITDEIIYTSEVCYDAETGDELGFEACAEAFQRGEDELYYSDKIIYGDMLRFWDERQEE